MGKGGYEDLDDEFWDMQEAWNEGLLDPVLNLDDWSPNPTPFNSDNEEDFEPYFDDDSYHSGTSSVGAYADSEEGVEESKQEQGVEEVKHSEEVPDQPDYNQMTRSQLSQHIRTLENARRGMFDGSYEFDLLSNRISNLRRRLAQMSAETLTLENLRVTNDFRDNLDWRLNQWARGLDDDDEKKDN